LYQLGETREEFGGSHFKFVQNLQGDTVPCLDTVQAMKLYETLHAAMMRGLVRSAHDMSEGGMAVAVAEMCIAGGLGATLTDTFLFNDETLFSETTSRFVIEVEPEHTAEIESLFKSFPIRHLGTVTSEPVLSFGNSFSVSVDELKSAWQKPLDW